MLCIVLVFASCGNEKKGETQIVEVDRPIFVPVPPDREPPPVRPPPRPGFIALDALENAMSLDLRSLSGDQERLETRYLIGCNFSNQNRDTDDFQQGVDLALNRLSSEIALVNTTPIGSSDCIYRLNLNDFTLTFSDWILLEDNAILDFVTKSIRGQELQFLTRTRKPYLFAQDALSARRADSLDSRVYVGGVSQPRLGPEHPGLTSRPSDLTRRSRAEGRTPHRGRRRFEACA